MDRRRTWCGSRKSRFRWNLAETALRGDGGVAPSPRRRPGGWEETYSFATPHNRPPRPTTARTGAIPLAPEGSPVTTGVDSPELSPTSCRRDPPLGMPAQRPLGTFSYQSRGRGPRLLVLKNLAGWPDDEAHATSEALPTLGGVAWIRFAAGETVRERTLRFPDEQAGRLAAPGTNPDLPVPHDHGTSGGEGVPSKEPACPESSTGSGRCGERDLNPRTPTRPDPESGAFGQAWQSPRAGLYPRPV